MASQIILPVLLWGLFSTVTPQTTPQVTPQATAQVTPQVTSGPFYPINGTTSSGSDDGSSPRIPLQRPFVYFGQSYNQIYVNHNGHMTFNAAYRSYIPRRFPLHGSRDIIAPFWTDLDNRRNGQIYYNQYTSGSILQQATRDINRYFPGLNFNANWVFVATWYEVAYFPNTGTRTTVQAVLISGGRYSFVLMNYGIIASTGRNVQAGYDTINSSNHFTIPGSFSNNATGTDSNFRLSSNVNVRGRWAFRIDHGSRGCTFNGQPVQRGDSFWSDSTCAQKCTCTSTGLQCHSQPCTFSQICRPAAFQFSCQTVQRGTCRISGDPHYYTFDKRLFHFQGTCTYVLSEQCGPRLPYYRVESKNEHRGSTHVSWTRLVKVFVYNETIELVKGHRGKAKVNGVYAATPIFLSNGMVQIYESGFSVIVSTDFGLEVSYDTNHYVRVRVPYTYQNATCGLCGNFNNQPEDDFRTPQGELVSSDVDFANSWQVSGADEPGCEPQCRGLDCAACSEAQKALYSNNAHCGILQSTSGPFAACHQRLPPQAFVESCVFDLCVGGGYQPILCQALYVYASQCQQNGIQLPSWRREGFCEIPCPANSHFESQGTGCPATCVNPNSTHSCPLPAQESCICNSSYILSAGVCVPHSECGCNFEGRYYRSGETVILDEDCGRRCSCSYGSMTCHSQGCGPLESCRVEEGDRGCRPNNNGTCWIRGPGSYQTFDGLIYHYPGACRLTLAKVMGLSSHPHFVVTAEKVPRGQQGFARVLKFEAEGTQISIEMTDSTKVQVDGQQIRLPFSSASNRIQIYHSSVQSIILRTSFGVTVQTVWPHFVRITAPVTYNGSLGGLCGNYNANPHDDFLTPNGILVNSSQDFGDSWRDGSLAAHCVENVNHNPNANSSEYCGIIGSPHGPFAQCWATVEPRQHVDACVEIIRTSRDPESTLCEILRDYALICQQSGVALGHWRNATGCEQNCPPNSHYEVCGTSCPSTCPSLSFPFACHTVCQEGCQCDDGFVLNGNQCVLPTACGCYHQGRYWRGGEQFSDGEECQSLCTCDGTTGAVHCIPNSCGPQESCRVVDGEFGCHPNPHGTCSASGDPHYKTFDGKAYDFQGTCRYTLATLCNATDGLHQFSVEAKNDPWRGLRVSITAEVFVNVWGYQVHMSRNSHGVVQVNGVTKNLPINLNGSRVSINARGSRTFVRADFGLTVTYDGRSRVSISVPPSYRGKTCGLCGNFNGNPNDEFHTPSGMTVTTPDELGTAWKVEGDYTCSDGCGSSCPRCINELPARAQCDVIQAADGPFSFCHEQLDAAPYFSDCVFDVCVTENQDQNLCRAIEAYASACQSANVRIYPWRQNTTCRLDCPANSHYELCGTDCGHTCASSNDATCEQGCSEGCFCDEGFLKSGTTCVPVERCGCQYDGFYYNAGESFWTEGCSQQCKCHAPNDLRCSAASCTSSQKCTIRNGQLGCFDDMTTCTVWGDPHYITFDHKTFDFQGTCRYVLATLCNDTAGLHGFSVEAKNEPWKGLTVSVTAEVFVNVWGYQVHMSRGSHGVVQVNGETKNLPVLLNGTRISIYARGSHTYLSADFGLTVEYDGSFKVSISVPSTYRGKTCGLCGNFNGNPNDEFHTRSGAIVTTPDEFGKAWKVEGDYTCSDGCGSSCPRCTNELPARAQCEVIQAADGPFSVCHKYVDPAPYFKSCVFDVCVAGPDSLCADIETYVSACQSANVQISPWRQNTTCRLDCPANSHYELCGTDCGHTCASSNDATCEQGCSEGCFCDEGFLRSGTTCVPVESCGCQYDGFYYNAGESFWTEGCSQRCKCHAPNDLRCSAASCTSTQECTIRNGHLGCFDDMTTCTVWGDPHYITFDGALAHFQGTCSYIITESVSHGTNETQFHVIATNNHRGNNRVSFVSAVDIYLKNHPEGVYIRIGPNKGVKINGIEMPLPITIGTIAQVERQENYIIVNAIDLIVQFDGRSTLLVRVGQHRQNRVRGMCGNFNSDPADDKVLPNGTLAQNDNHFGHSWKSPTGQPGCGSTDEDGGDGLNDCPFKEEYSELCSVITNSSGPFSACQLHSDPQPFFTSCVYDLCQYTPANGMLCSAVSAYERTCAVLGLNIPEWRSALQCTESDPCEQLDCTEHEWCGQKNGVYGCFCDEQHRDHNGSYDLSITCGRSSGIISMSRCQLFEAGFQSNALHLRDDACRGYLQDGRLVFTFNNDDELCGTVFKNNRTHYIYENTILGHTDPHQGLISRRTSIDLRFCCEYPLTQALSMVVGINPVERIVRKKHSSGSGLYHMRMIPYQDADFRFPLISNKNIQMETDQRLYVEVRTEGVDGRLFDTVLDSCWATPVNLASYPVRWDLISAECPNPADGTVELIQSGISNVARFSFRMFKFDNFPSTYLHCKVHLCPLTNNNCTANCDPNNHRQVKRDVSYHATTDISLGPLTLAQHQKVRMVK